MSTEDAGPLMLDQVPLGQALRQLFDELEVPKAVRAAEGPILSVVEAIIARIQKGGRLCAAGAGTPARIAQKDFSELDPTYGFPRKRTHVFVAGGKKALARSIEGAEDDVRAAKRDVRRTKLRKRDVVIAISASGTTPYTLEVMRQAKRRGALTIGIAHNSGTPTLLEADKAIFLNTKHEPVAGSTRMKAGSAQDVVLKIITTLVMVTLGYIYMGLMVSVRPRNKKLKARAVRILRKLTSCTDEEAVSTLKRAKWEIGVAVVTFREDCPLKRAKKLFLKKHDRNLAKALESYQHMRAA